MAVRPLLTMRRARRPGARRGGFSLVELVIGTLISVVLLAAGVRALLALINGDSAMQQELNRKDDISRVLGLIQDETRNAQRVETGASLAPVSNACSTQAQLILRGSTSSEDISYGLMSNTLNGTWRGNVLMRCGPTYNSDGSLNTASGASEQGVLDRLGASGFTAAAQGGAGAISRNVSISVISNASIDKNISQSAQTSTIQVPINTTPVYGAAASALSCGSSGCNDPNGYQVHYQPTLGGSDISASSDKENIFYFPNNRSTYTLSRSPGSGSCTAEQCTVRDGSTGPSITFFNGSVLVFKDTDIRL